MLYVFLFLFFVWYIYIYIYIDMANVAMPHVLFFTVERSKVVILKFLYGFVLIDPGAFFLISCGSVTTFFVVVFFFFFFLP